MLTAILVNPLESARVLALLAAGPDGGSLGPFGAYLVGRAGPLGAAGLLAGALLAWTVLPLAAAAGVLQRRDVNS